MIHKEFINNLYDGVDELPAYNYYKSDENIKYLLKNKRLEINEIEELRLHEIHNEYREWIAKELHKEKYQNHLHDLGTKIALEKRIAKLQTIKTIINLRKFDFVLMSEAFAGFEIKRIQKQLSECLTPYMPTIDNMVSITERAIKGISSELGMMATTKEKEVNFDYVHEVVQMSRYLKIHLTATELTLAEWVNYNKMIQKDAK